MSRYLRILCVCTFNRARSVAMAGHLHEELRRQRVHAHVVGAGFGPAGQPPLPEVTAALAHYGIDVAGVRSRIVDRTTVNGADLLITAERIHVVRLSEDHLDVFARTFTLPELVALGEAFGPRAGSPIEEWLAEVGVGRTTAAFLSSAVTEIADPTGLAEVAIGASVAEIGEWCRRLAALL